MEKIFAEVPFVSISIIVPIIFSILVLIFRESLSKYLALLGTGITFLISLIVLALFDYSKTQVVQFYE